jgi:hypothetical protein
MDPGHVDDAALSQSPPESRLIGPSVTVSESEPEAWLPQTIWRSVLTAIADRLAAPPRGKIPSMSPEELRERLERAGLTPHRLSYLLDMEPNSASKWTRGALPVPRRRVARIIEVTDIFSRSMVRRRLRCLSKSRRSAPGPRSARCEPAAASCFVI